MKESYELKPGNVTDDHFHLLLVGTSIRGEKVIKALREHLVNGTPKGQSVAKHGANFSQFSVRLATLHEESERIAHMVKFYTRHDKPKGLEARSA